MSPYITTSLQMAYLDFSELVSYLFPYFRFLNKCQIFTLVPYSPLKLWGRQPKGFSTRA